MSSRKGIAVAAGVGLLLLLVMGARIGLRSMFGNPWPDFARWLIWSPSYKAAAMAQPEPENHELKHIEWDGWGWGGEDNYVYLVFDPADLLSGAARSHQPGKYNGIPCEVFVVRRLEEKWYTVRFYTDRVWKAGC
jgi:hypothetical protein